MEYTKEQVIDEKLNYVSITEFINVYHPNLTPPAINYAILNNLIDHFKPGHERLILLTKKTMDYTPKRSQARRLKSRNKF